MEECAPASRIHGLFHGLPITPEMAAGENLTGSSLEDLVEAQGMSARAEGSPRLKISDRKLGALAGVTVHRRLLHDAATGEVWFLDTDGEIHVFDGYDIVEPPFQIRPVGYGHMRAFLDGIAELSERAIFWDRRADAFVEIIRYEDRLTYMWGRNKQALTGNLGLAFGSESDAARAFACLKAGILASGMVESSPWYVPGRGAIMRTYYTPDAGGRDSANDYLRIFDRKVEPRGSQHATDEEAATEHQTRELELQRDRDSGLSCLEWQERCRRPEDLTVREWIRKRIRDDSRDAAWHVRALTEIMDYLTAHGYGDLIGAIEVQVGSGVSEEEIAAFEALREHPIPDALRAFWREIGHASWSTGTSGLRVLSPSRTLNRRHAALELGECYMRETAPGRADFAVLAALDVLVDTLDGNSIISVHADRRAVDGRVFTHVDSGPHDLWWEKSLSVTLATRFLHGFADVIEEAAPMVSHLRYGQRLNPDAERHYFEARREGRATTFWELFYDATLGVISTRSGKIGEAGAVRTWRYDDPARAEQKVAKLVTARRREGYRAVESPRTRPATVPGGAWYVQESGEWAAGEIGVGGRTGPWCFWRADGTFAEESRWRAGRRHGTHRRYHDDGSLALQAEWVDGRQKSVIAYRADAPSQEKTPLDDLPDSIMVLVQEFDDEGYFIRQRLRTVDGSEVDPDGQPLPPRPNRVPEEAEHFSRFGHWTVGRKLPGAELVGVGLHRFWTTHGVIKQVEYHSGDGQPPARIGWTGASGNPLIEAARAGDDEAVDLCLAIGLGASPGTVLHAAYEGLSQLVLRLQLDDVVRTQLADPRAEPERRGSVPVTAEWVAGLESWVCGVIDPIDGTPVDTWRMWRSTPKLDRDQPVEVDFVEGRRARLREYNPWRPDVLHREFYYASDGEQILDRLFEDGTCHSEDETLPDGTTAIRRFHGDGTLQVERIESDGNLLAEAWFTEGGVRIAQVEPSHVSVKGEPVEWWHALDTTGATIAEGAVRPGITGGPVGRWQLFDADGLESGTVSFAKLTVGRRGDLGHLAAAVRAWQTMPMPAALAGIDKVAWDELGTFFERDGVDFPFLLKGLAVPDERAFHLALDSMWNEVLHDHAISEVAAPTIRFMTGLADAMGRDDLRAELLEFILRVATRDDGLGATMRLKVIYETAPEDESPSRHFAAHTTESGFHEIYASLADAVPTWTRLAAGGPGISRATRQCAIHLLAAAPGEEAAAALRACLIAETERRLRAAWPVGPDAPAQSEWSQTEWSQSEWPNSEWPQGQWPQGQWPSPSGWAVRPMSTRLEITMLHGYPKQNRPWADGVHGAGTGDAVWPVHAPWTTRAARIGHRAWMDPGTESGRHAEQAYGGAADEGGHIRDAGPGTGRDMGRDTGRDTWDRGLVADMLLGLALHPGQITQDMLEPFLRDNDPLLRFCAALTWIRNGCFPPGPALPILTEVLTGRHDLSAFGTLFLAVGDAQTDAVGALALLPPEVAGHCLADVCAVLDSPGLLGEPDPLGSIEITRALLDIVLPGAGRPDGTRFHGPLADDRPLTDHQRTVVQVISDSKADWTFGGRSHVPAADRLA